MQELLKDNKVNYNKLKSRIHKIAASELTKLVKPCYYPEYKKYESELYRLLGVTKKDMQEFVKRFWKGHPASKWLLEKDPYTMAIIVSMRIFGEKKDMVPFTSAVTFLCIKYYRSWMDKMMQYCNEPAFRWALDNVTKTNLFAREKGIANALYFLAKEEQKRFSKGIITGDQNETSKFIRECRGRIGQSVKSFAETYYKAQEAGIGISEIPDTDDDDEMAELKTAAERHVRVIENTTKKICVYRVIDKKSMDNARKLAKVNEALAEQIIQELTNLKYIDNVRIILQLFVSKVKTVKDVCGKDYPTFVRKLMGIKRTKERIFFKQQVNVLLTKIVKEIKYDKDFKNLTNQTQFIVSLYLAYYITGVMKNSLC